VTLLFTATGALLTAFSMGFFFEQTIWVWLPNFVSGIEQSVLFVMCVIFMYRERREEKKKIMHEKENLLSLSSQNSK
jgi:hypothetical protein